MKIGIISARAHLVEARRNHRDVFSKGLDSVSMQDCHRVNNELGVALKKLHKFGVTGKCNDDRYFSASTIVKSLFIKDKRNRARSRL
jgi:hypothetical protein